jgi:hypothetical protein
VALNNKKKESISLEVIRVLKSKFDDFPENPDSNRNAPFHEAFLNAFSEKLKDKLGKMNIPYIISLSSWMHGLNTSLGQSFFENVAHILSEGQKKDFKKVNILKYSHKQSALINDEIIRKLKDSSRMPNLEKEDKEIFAISDGDIIDAEPFTADNFVQDDEIVEAIELKTVRPNSGEMQGEKRKILIAKAALKNKYPNKEIKFYLGFPFDPTSKSTTGSDKDRFMANCINMKKFLDKEEILLAEELWDHLSEQKNTMQEILDIINNIATPEFENSFDFINKYEEYRKDPKKDNDILKKWNLYSEIDLMKVIDKIEKASKENKHLQRIIHKNRFKSDCHYDKDRNEELISHIS